MENFVTVVVTYDVETNVNGEIESGEACAKFEFIPKDRVIDALEYIDGEHNESRCIAAITHFENAIIWLETLRRRHFVYDSIKSIKIVPHD